MLDYTLSKEQLAELRASHRATHDKREADRIKAMVLPGTGWTAEDVAEVLQVDPNTVRNRFKAYRQGGLDGLKHMLTAEQLEMLDLHVRTHLYLTAKDIGHWVEETFGVATPKAA